ncbi:hypothetical protein U9M48_001209 [Paspalum notatum var. saurae]|uniref:Mixed lineage kinase domain-containing protein n=1 Tax=Paspalum notatum var. saurae TaxID=547442 RepID=A0AAQ3PG25_PASNO
MGCLNSRSALLFVAGRMADPVAAVEKIVKLGLKIKDAVDTVSHNEEECNEIRRRVLRFSAILSQLQQTGMMNDSPALSGALEDLEETLARALELVTACQERTTIRRLVTAGDLSKKLRQVKDDILNKVMLASFAINAHTTIILLTIQAGGHPLPQQTEATISDGYVIGEDGFWKVYKCVLNDGNAVAVKVLKEQESRLDWPSISRIIEGGYMSPEYVSDGIVSLKNDVYGFGATLLETVSTMYVSSDSDLLSSIYGPGVFEAIRKAWSAWEDGRMEGLFDPSLFDGSDQLMEIKRCTQVGLLCIQAKRADLPTMADVLAMLHGEKDMPAPKIPADYFNVRKEESLASPYWSESDGDR